MNQSQRRSSQRRLSFVTQEQQRPCELCRNSHPEISSPQQWKSEQARELVKSLGVGEKGTVCRPCRQDVTRMAANPSHIPRWDKIRDQCCISSCNEQVYARSKMASKERMMAILQEQELHYVDEVPVPTPLCRHHYHRVYNLLQPTHTNCSACGISLKHTPMMWTESPWAFPGSYTTGLYARAMVDHRETKGLIIPPSR